MVGFGEPSAPTTCSQDAFQLPSLTAVLGSQLPSFCCPLLVPKPKRLCMALGCQSSWDLPRSALWGHLLQRCRRSSGGPLPLEMIRSWEEGRHREVLCLQGRGLKKSPPPAPKDMGHSQVDIRPCSKALMKETSQRLSPSRAFPHLDVKPISGPRSFGLGLSAE